MKLNLGCGAQLMHGYLNVDKYGDADLIHDLEHLPWPWPDNSIEEVRLIHVLEHLGRDTAIFKGIIQELYRVCRAGAVVYITVPHHRHDCYHGDPTHVRPITEETLRLLSRRLNLEYRSKGYANSCLALEWGVDFEIADLKYHFDGRWKKRLDSGQITTDVLLEAAMNNWNVVEMLEFAVKVVKL